VLASPLKFDGQRPPNRAAPLLGADSDALLAELGYSADEIAALHRSGVI
jgi:crotonobetainyl-CoA:carnitine CoA-transferase CaiB-like acyl-CoA transferase